MDRFSLPDEYAKTSQLGETGAHRGIDARPSPEELEGDVSRPHGRTAEGTEGDVLGRAGGEGGWQLLVDGESTDLEGRELLDEFLKERYPNLLDEDENFDSDEVMPLGDEFYEWLGSDDKDTIKKEEKLPELSSLADQEEEFAFGLPKKEKPNKKPEIPFYKNTPELSQYNLRFNEAALSRLAEGAQGKAGQEVKAGIAAAKEAFAALTKGSQDIEAFGFETSRKRIENVVIQTKPKTNSRGEKVEGMEIKVPSEIFARAFGIWHHSDANGYEGFKFYAGGNRREEYITPKTPEAILDRIMIDEVSFNGVRLDPGVYVWKGPSRQPTDEDVKELYRVPELEKV